MKIMYRNVFGAGLFVLFFIVHPFGISSAKASSFSEATGIVSLGEQLNPVLLKAVKVYSDNPFELDFVIDVGDSIISEDKLQTESIRLIKYFLAAVTIPEKDLWVNLSPYEKQRIIPQSFGFTEMGRDLLLQDYVLKQVTASITYPESSLGKEFWAKLYQEAQNRYGTVQTPLDTYNRVWIIPSSAVVYETQDAAYVVESRLKVLCEEDYLAMDNNQLGSLNLQGVQERNSIGADTTRKFLIPILEKEVNEGKNFASLRQIYSSLILATWYKEKIKNSILKYYVDKNKISGVDISDKQAKEEIWAQYVQAFKNGSYNYIREEIDAESNEVVPKKYFSGGTALALGKGLVKLHIMPESVSSSASAAQKVVHTNLMTDSVENTGNYKRFLDWLKTINLSDLNFRIDVIRTLANDDIFSLLDTSAYSDAFAYTWGAMINAGYVTREDVVENSLIRKFQRGLSKKTFVNAVNSNAYALAVLVAQGLSTEEEVFENLTSDDDSESLVRALRGDLTYAVYREKNSNSSEQYSWKILDDSRISEIPDSENLVEMLTKGRDEIRIRNVQALVGGIEAGLINKEALIERIKESGLAKILIEGMDNGRQVVRDLDAEILLNLINAQLVSTMKDFRTQVRGLFKEVYSKDIPEGNYFNNYLTALFMFKDAPAAAYQLAFWNSEQLDGLLEIINYFVNGVEGSVYISAGVKKFDIDVIKSFLPLMNDPTLLLSSLREKIKATIRLSRFKLCISFYEASAAKAAKGFVKALGLNNDKVIMVYTPSADELISLKNIEAILSGFRVFMGTNRSKDDVVYASIAGDYGVTFDDLHKQPTIPTIPYKNYSSRSTDNSSRDIRKDLKIPSSRQVIVLGSLETEEFHQFREVYKQLYGHLAYMDRPLLIIAFRKVMISESNATSVLGIPREYIEIRKSFSDSYPDLSQKAVLVINTMGELGTFYEAAKVKPGDAASLSLIGGDRNIVEPADAQSAILYFDQSKRFNQREYSLLTDAGAAKVFTRENLVQLLRSPETVSEMGRKGHAVLDTDRGFIESAAVRDLAFIIGATPEWRKDFLQNNSATELQSPIDQPSAESIAISQETTGGVNLSNVQQALKTGFLNEGTQFKITPAIIEEIQNADGLRPVVLNIEPLDNLPQFLGVKLKGSSQF